MHHFEPILRRVKTEHDIRVKRWRRHMSGCAWQVRHADGRVVRWIESPYPRTPISLSLFLHEVGHHAIGFETYSIRCEEEFHAWNWAIEQMQSMGIGLDEKVQRRYELSMRYEVAKAIRRGGEEIPEELMRFHPRAA
jgi:hypothetical protein